MMDERNESDNKLFDEVMLPGFRFHPTDEELVGFYLKRKIQQIPLSFEIINQVDIYKYDPWDLPKLASMGEKEWYFYCPRDRKYRNSGRPNRVTEAGFWKATGTDRPIYNSQTSSNCIGLKKSLVFYKGRAAKGIKTDWMMHEFRLPSTTDPSKRYIQRHVPANDAWAICRIFKKTNNSISQRAQLSHSCVSHQTHETTTSHTTQLSSLPQQTNTSFQYFGAMNNLLLLDNSSSITTYSTLDYHVPTCYTSIDHQTSDDLITTNHTFSSTETPEPAKCAMNNDASSLLLNMSSSIFGDLLGENVEYIHGEGFQDNYGGAHQPELVKDSNSDDGLLYLEEQLLGNIRSIAFPYYDIQSSLTDVWKSNLVWDSSSSPCPSSEISTNYSITSVILD